MRDFFNCRTACYSAADSPCLPCSYLHFFDNRLLPQHVEPDVAKSQPHWWYDPNYLINELNVNVRPRKALAIKTCC